MPIYEYMCPKCAKIFEATNTVEDREYQKCLVCASPCRLLISKNNFILSGSGWAKDGY